MIEKLKLYKFKILVGILGILVFAGAVFGGCKFGQRSIYPEPVEGPIPTPGLVATPTPGPTANWKTYKNEEYSFEIKYPPSWKLEEKDVVLVNNVMEIADMETNIPLTLGGPVGPMEVRYQIGLDVLPNPENKNLHDLVFSSFGFIDEEINFEEGKVGDYKVFRTTDFPSMDGLLDVFFEVNNGLRYIHFRLYPYWNEEPFENQAEVLPIFNQILSTFKFLE